MKKVLLVSEYRLTTRDEINSAFEELLKFPTTKFSSRPRLDLTEINPFFDDDRFVMNYVAELGM